MLCSDNTTVCLGDMLSFESQSRQILGKICQELALNPFFEFCGRNPVCFGTAYNFDRGRHWQIRAGSRKGTHACCVFHVCRREIELGPRVYSAFKISTAETWEKLCTCNSNHSRTARALRFYFEMMSRLKRTNFLLLFL